jgi:hypothetical protein
MEAISMAATGVVLFTVIYMLMGMLIRRPHGS